jgi:hypothetical protein
MWGIFNAQAASLSTTLRFPRPGECPNQVCSHLGHPKLILCAPTRLADSDNGATAMAMTGSDQGAYNSYVSVNTYWADTTAMDNLRGADITDHTIAGSVESISANTKHTDSNLAAP